MAEVLPYDAVDCDDLLNGLAGAGFIRRYQVGTGRFIQITQFTKHQQPHYKEPLSEIPPPPGHTDSPIITAGVPNEQRQRIMERDGSRCRTCGATDNLTIDHVIPRTLGGDGTDSNLQVLCRRCNSSKNNRLASSAIQQPTVNVGPTSDQARPMESASCAPVPTYPVPTVLDPVPTVLDREIQSLSTVCIADATHADAQQLTLVATNGTGHREVAALAPWPDRAWAEAAFDECFWPHFRRKTNKAKGKAAYVKLLMSCRTFDQAYALAQQIMEVVIEQFKHWTDLSKSPAAESYINGRRWEDEHIIPTGPANGRAARYRADG